MNILDFIRGLTRPVIAYTLVLAYVGLLGAGLHTGSFEAAKLAAPLTGVALTYWFVDRTNSKRDQGS